MQKLLILCLFSLLNVVANAQDKIITTGQDTIDCRILSISAEHIRYEQKSTDGYVVGKLIPIEQVAIYYRLSQSHPSVLSKRPERPWLISVNAGGSWMPLLFEGAAEIPNSGKDLAKGFHLNASGHYLINQLFGVGIQYSFFQSSVKGEYPFTNGSNSFYYSMLFEKEKQYINYVGPSVVFQQFLNKNKRFQLSETLSGGVLFYRYESQLSTTYSSSSHYYSTYSKNTLISGRTFGATLGISAEYYVLPFLSIGLGGDFLFGLLRKVDGEQRDSGGQNNKIKNQELDESLKISRLDYSLGLRFHF